MCVRSPHDANLFIIYGENQILTEIELFTAALLSDLLVLHLQYCVSKEVNTYCFIQNCLEVTGKPQRVVL